MTKSLIMTAALGALVLAAGRAGAQGQPQTPSETPPAGQPQTQTPGEPAAAAAPICTDRPAKANATCTAPAGDVQIESDIVNWSRASAGGVTSTTTLVTNPTLKYGVRPNLDVEAIWAPWVEVRTTVHGRAFTASSVGDLFLRTKWEAISRDAVSLALIPYVKLPTASHEVGDGHVEGGLLAPMTVVLPAKFTVTLMPELDVLENADRTGAHVNAINAIELTRAFGRWTVFGELWNDQDFEPAGTIAQTTADVAVAYLVAKTLQLDAGANFGLDRAAPQQQYYLGVSKRF